MDEVQKITARTKIMVRDKNEGNYLISITVNIARRQQEKDEEVRHEE